MSDRRSLRASTTAQPQPPPKRARKNTPRNTNDDKQRERKRALDRKAQRASREKTRSHIAHLEKMVQILSEKNGSQAMGEMMQEMGRLNGEIERLRKIIEGIKSVLGCEVFEKPVETQQRRISPSPDGDKPSTPKTPKPNESINVLCEVNSPSDNSALQPPQNWEQDDYTGLDPIPEAEASGAPPEDDASSNSTSSPPFSWTGGPDESTVALTSRWDTLRTGPSQHSSPIYTAFWNLPPPLKTPLPPPHIHRSLSPGTSFQPCEIWKKANSIYAGIFRYPKERISMAREVQAGSLVKVVKEGWGSLSLRERSNPVLQILKDVDQQLFWDLDPVTKLANLYKSMLLLKYYFNAEESNLEQMPLWQRPVHSQKVRRHPIPIDFFPWPALRDRLVRHHNYYFATSEFSVHYRQHFKFSWPFTFADTYRYDPESKSYELSPLFERYHRDMRCWSLEQCFFEKFPELRGEISVHRISDAVGSPQEGLMEEMGQGMVGVDNSVDIRGPMVEGAWAEPGNFGMENAGFPEECVMELFNDYPPT